MRFHYVACVGCGGTFLCNAVLRNVVDSFMSCGAMRISSTSLAFVPLPSFGCVRFRARPEVPRSFRGPFFLPLTGVFRRLACKSNAGCLRVFCCARVSFFFYIFPTAVMGLNMTPLWCSRFCPTSGHLLIKTTSGGGGGWER